MNLILTRNRFFLFFLFILSFQNVLLAQLGIQDQSKWTITGQTIETRGDSTVNGMTYLKCWKKEPNNSQEKFVGLMRSDASKNKYYFIEANGVNEHLMYDFDVITGDVIEVYGHNYFTDDYSLSSVKVAEIDSVTVNGVKKKRLRIRSQEVNLMDEFWIQDIGSSFGILYSGFVNKVRLDNSFPTLSCFEVENTLYYSNSNECISALFNTADSGESVGLFPNPASKSCTIYGVDEKIVSVELHDINGKKILSTTNVVLDLEHFENGIYIVEINTGTEIKFKRLHVSN